MSVEGSDEALQALAAVGEETALGKLYDRYARPVFSQVQWLVRDLKTAEELTHEVFLRIWLYAADNCGGRWSASRWILDTTQHAAVDELRRRATHPTLGPRPSRFAGLPGGRGGRLLGAT